MTGMHLLAKFGRTADEIRRAGFRIHATVKMQAGLDDPRAEAAAVGRGMAGIANELDRLECDAVLVLGDRIEAFAGAAAASASRRLLVHIHGGDRATGDIDDALRNAITRLAHVHLVASTDAADRLKRMGEEPKRIHRVGAPGLDDIRELHRSIGRKSPLTPELAEQLGSSGERPYAVVLQHPAALGSKAETQVMRAICEAVEQSELGGVAIYPNSDPGHDGIISVIEHITEKPEWVAFRSLDRETFIRLATNAAVMIGNSSSGIIESATLGINVVNVGERQAGRLRCGPNVLDCGTTQAAIYRTLQQALKRRRPTGTRSVYGDGQAGRRIADVLERLIITPELLRKAVTY